MRTRWGVWVLGAAIGLPALGQAATWSLTLDDAVRLAERQSPAARRLALEERRDSAVQRRARSGVYPQLAFELALPEFAQRFSVAPLPSAPGDTVTGSPRLVYGKITTTSRNASSGLRLEQRLPWRGTMSAEGVVVYHDEETSPEGVSQSRNDYQINASVGLDVPLLGDDGHHRALQRAGLDYDAARERWRSDRARLEFDTVSQYLQLRRARAALDLSRAASERAAMALEVARGKVSSGVMAEVDRMRVDVFLADSRSRLAAAESEWQRAADEFKLHLGLELADSLALVEELVAFDPALDESHWQELALGRRAEVGLLERDVVLLEADRKAARGRRPALDFAVRYGGGASDSRLDDAISELTANDLSLRLGLRVSLADGGRSGADDVAARAGIGLRELDAEDARRRIVLEVRDAVRQMAEAVRRHGALAASDRLASELLRISNERYERGLIDTQTYLGAQDEAAAAQFESQAALLDLYRARARLRFVALEDE